MNIPTNFFKYANVWIAPIPPKYISNVLEKESF